MRHMPVGRDNFHMADHIDPVNKDEHGQRGHVYNEYEQSRPGGFRDSKYCKQGEYRQHGNCYG